MEKAYYILKYYPLISEQGNNYISNITHDLVPIDRGNSSYILKIKNKYDTKYNTNFMNYYIFLIYMKNKINFKMN